MTEIKFQVIIRKETSYNMVTYINENLRSVKRRHIDYLLAFSTKAVYLAHLSIHYLEL